MIQKNWQDLIKPNKVEFQAGSARTKATLVAEPLERGFGLTLGNALRRVLLSSLRGAAITAVQIDGGYDRVDPVGKQGILAASTGHHLGPPEFQDIAKADVAGDIGAGLLADKGVVAGGELAFSRGLIGAEQRLGHDEAEDTVAEEFEPLVVGSGGRGDGGMGDGADQERRVAEGVPDAAGKGVEIGRGFQSTALKKRSARQVQT